MKEIGTLFKQNIEVKKTNIKSERADLINQFLIKLNNERYGTKYKPLTPRAVAIKLAHVPTDDLYFFYKKCSQSSSFGKCFFGCLKSK